MAARSGKARPGLTCKRPDPHVVADARQPSHLAPVKVAAWHFVGSMENDPAQVAPEKLMCACTSAQADEKAKAVAALRERLYADNLRIIARILRQQGPRRALGRMTAAGRRRPDY